MTLEQALDQITRMEDKLRTIRSISGNRFGTSSAWNEVYEQAEEALKPPTRKVNYACACVELPEGYTAEPMTDDLRINGGGRLKFEWRIEEKEIPL